MWKEVKLRKEFRGKHEVGSQPFERAVAYEMGRQCPVGRELDLLFGLDSFWPDLPRSEAFDFLLQGLADRFNGDTMSTETATTNKPLKELDWHLRGADPEKDLSGKGWVHEQESTGYKTRVCATPADAALAARRIQRLSEDPSADLRTCPECRFTYDTNDRAEAEEHADHAHSSDVSADGEESKNEDPAQHEEFLLGEVKDFLEEQQVEITDSGTTPFCAASYLETGTEVIVVACDQRSMGLDGCILDAMRRRTGAIRTACVVACCVTDSTKYETAAGAHGVEVLSFEVFEASRTATLGDVIIRELNACNTLPDFQRIVRAHELEKAMDYESDPRFPGPELERVFDAIDACATRVGLRRPEAESLTDDSGDATQNISGDDSGGQAGAEPPLAVLIVGALEEISSREELDGLIATHELDAIRKGDRDARFNHGERASILVALAACEERCEGVAGDADSNPDAAAAPASESLFDESESSRGASAPLAALVAQMHPSKIRRHPLLLMRAAGLDEGHVRELEEVLKSGGRFKDPNVVFFDGEVYWNAAGNHRHEAALRQNALLDVDVRNGTFEDAVEFAAGSNYDHGLKRSDNDKRLAVVTLLANAKNFGLSDGLLAKKAHVTPPFVGDVRDYVARLIPHIDGGAGAEQLAERAGVPAGLAHVVLSLPDETFSSLSNNVTNDDGRRLGGDGRVYTVKAAPAVVEETPASLFDEPPAPVESQASEQSEQAEPAEETSVEQQSDVKTPDAFTQPQPDQRDETHAAVEEQREKVVVNDHRRFADELDTTSPAAPTPTQAPAQTKPTPSPQATPSPSVEEQLKGRAMSLSFTWIPGLKGKVSVSVNVGGKPPNEATRALLEVSPLSPLFGPVMYLISSEIARSNGGTVKKTPARRAEQTSSPKAERILKAIRDAKTPAELVAAEKHYKLSDLSRFSTGDAALIGQALTKRRREVAKTGGAAKGATKGSTKKSSSKSPAKKGASKGSSKKSSATKSSKKK